MTRRLQAVGAGATKLNFNLSGVVEVRYISAWVPAKQNSVKLYSRTSMTWAG